MNSKNIDLMSNHFFQNISQFSERDFDVVNWINDSLKDKSPNQCREVLIIFQTLI